MQDEHTERKLTRGMRATLLTAGAIVLVGIAIAVWLLVTAGTTGRGGDPDASGSPSSTATRGPVPGSTPAAGSEVLPPTGTNPPNRVPPRTSAPADAPLVKAPLPKSGTKDGDLVQGFPTEIMGPLTGSDVVSTAIASQGDTMQVTLVARTDASEDEIRAHYEKQWASLGLREDASSTENTSYVGAYESLSLAVTTTGTGVQYSIFGVFRAE